MARFMTSYTYQHCFLIRLAIATIICGVIIFLYGIIISNPAIFSSVLVIKASLLGGESIVISSALPSVPQELFIFACALIITGASIDVWMRLHSHYHCHSDHAALSNDPFDYMNHDHVLEEPHFW